MDLLLDVNVILDICQPRPAFQAAALDALTRCHDSGGRIWLYVGSVQTLEYSLLRGLLRDAQAAGSGLSVAQAQHQARRLLGRFGADKHWLAALAGEGDVFQAADPEDEQLVRALDRFAPGGIALLTRDEALLARGDMRIVSPQQWLQRPVAARAMPFVDLQGQQQALRPQLEARLQCVLHGGQYIMGPEVQELEAALAAFTGARHCITVASGTEALLIALMALDLEPGDEVITTPFTFAATVETIVLLGGKPVFVDIEPDTCNIDAGLIEAAITPRTRAIMPVSLYGQVADMAEINAIAAQHGGIPVIEDAAQSFGAVYRGRRSCALSTWGATSFFPSKPLGCYGDGGALFTDDDALAQAAREIRVHGQSQRYRHTRVGVGGRMDTLQCAVVLAKLERFEWELRRRAELGARYQRLLAEAGVRQVAVRPGRNSVWAQVTVFVERRAEVQTALQAAGIPTAVHYPIPLNRQPAYAALCCEGCTPHADAAAAQVLSLPMSADLTEADQDRVVRALADALAAQAA